MGYLIVVVLFALGVCAIPWVFGLLFRYFEWCEKKLDRWMPW